MQVDKTTSHLLTTFVFCWINLILSSTCICPSWKHPLLEYDLSLFQPQDIVNMYSMELDSMIPMGSFQLGIFYGCTLQAERRSSCSMLEKHSCFIPWDWCVNSFAPALPVAVLPTSSNCLISKNMHIHNGATIISLRSHTWNINPCYDPFTPSNDLLQLILPSSARKKQLWFSVVSQIRYC